VLANPTRQRILEMLLAKAPLDVSTVARSAGIDLPTASRHLRALQSRGLLAAEAAGRHLFYRPWADPSVAQAAPMLAALKASIQRHEPIPARLQALTAFTHSRRILILRTMAAGASKAESLTAGCRIPSRALYRHMDKLKRRGVVRAQNAASWQLVRSEPGLLLDLVTLVLGES
jgi:predicted ArsR family transcriptional regulator